MKQEKVRLAQLRSMPYEQYLESPEWQRVQKAALKRSENRCHGCNADGVTLSAYHTSFENLGCEQEDDVIVLCEACHDRLAQYGKQAQSDGTLDDRDGAQAYPTFSLGKKTAIFGPTALFSIGLPALLHAPLPAEVGGLIVAIVIAANSPKIYARMREDLPAPLVAWIEKQAERKRQRAATGEWSAWDRLLGRHMYGGTPNNVQELASANEKVAHQPAEEGQKLPKIVILAPDVNIPLGDLAGKSIFIVGMRRSGKTTLGVRIAEQLGKYLIPMLIPDKEGDWLSLGEVLPRGVILYGPKKDHSYYEQCYSYRLPLEWAEETGYEILEKGYQAILDLDSYATLDEAIQVQIALIKGLFRWAEEHPHDRTTCQVFLDEAQRYLPETLDNSIIKDKAIRASLLDLYRDLTGVGGKRGLSPVILSQRFAETNKKIIAQTEVYFVLRQTSDNDLDRVMEYVKKATATREQISAFAKGQGIYYATDGTQVLTRFYSRESDGSRSHTPSPETAQRYANIPMREPDITKRSSKSSAPDTQPEVQPAASAPGSVATPAPATVLPPNSEVVPTAQSAPEVQRQQSRQHHTRTINPALQMAYEVYRPGMKHHSLARYLGVSPATAGHLLQQLHDHGYIDVQGNRLREDEKIVSMAPRKEALRAEDIDLQVALQAWFEEGFDSEDKLMRKFPGLTKYQANKLRARMFPKKQQVNGQMNGQMNG